MFKWLTGETSEEDIKSINKGLKSENASLVKENKKLKADIETEREARAKAAEGVVDTIKDLLNEAGEQHSDFVEAILEKLPKVDLTKMSVNIEVPSPEVHINTGGGKQGGDNKPKN